MDFGFQVRRPQRSGGLGVGVGGVGVEVGMIRLCLGFRVSGLINTRHRALAEWLLEEHEWQFKSKLNLNKNPEPLFKILYWGNHFKIHILFLGKRPEIGITHFVRTKVPLRDLLGGSWGLHK